MEDARPTIYEPKPSPPPRQYYPTPLPPVEREQTPPSNTPEVPRAAWQQDEEWEELFTPYASKLEEITITPTTRARPAPWDIQPGAILWLAPSRERETPLMTSETNQAVKLQYPEYEGPVLVIQALWDGEEKGRGWVDFLLMGQLEEQDLEGGMDRLMPMVQREDCVMISSDTEPLDTSKYWNSPLHRPYVLHVGDGGARDYKKALPGTYFVRIGATLRVEWQDLRCFVPGDLEASRYRLEKRSFYMVVDLLESRGIGDFDYRSPGAGTWVDTKNRWIWWMKVVLEE
ncbi:hypothetical protein BP6252_05037 [Coleophoma cylindrospora]|uniref:Uncharacterized protein n=1 Tax=Coleophoma cylindrospora TaxID=1849047 RepID=A0A3D8RSY7_9HELO|nr:hypothetical protein BP6252_05037 [Coleophoma cylindrospora]